MNFVPLNSISVSFIVMRKIKNRTSYQRSSSKRILCVRLSVKHTNNGFEQKSLTY